MGPSALRWQVLMTAYRVHDRYSPPTLHAGELVRHGSQTLSARPLPLGPEGRRRTMPSVTYTSMREPIITVRSPGRPKCSAASAVIYDVAMNSRLRHGAIVGAVPFFSSIRDKK